MTRVWSSVEEFQAQAMSLGAKVLFLKWNDDKLSQHNGKFYSVSKNIKATFEPLHFSGLFWTWNSVNGLTSVHVNTKCREKFCQLTFARVVELEAKTQWVQRIFYIAFEYLCSQIDHTKNQSF